MQCDSLWTHAQLAPMAEAGPWLIEDGVVASKGGRIVYAGPMAGAPEFTADETINCDGRLITPGLIDCHTHLIHAGSRAGEFEARLEGTSYETIARAGGGIVSTMRATRAASEDDLVVTALPRLDALIAEGVTTVEVKSGYGLSLEHEMKSLSAARRLEHERDIAIKTTFLGAHALPPEFLGKPDAYIDTIAGQMIPAIAAAGLADAVDGFCEGIGFTADQIGRVFAAATKARLPVKLHAEQLSNLHGAALAAKHNALSADHLEWLDDDGVAAMAASGTVAVLLPGAYYFTRETKLPPVEALRAAGVPIAIATDCNPGTSPLTSILLVMNMGATLFRLTVAECLTGVTRNAARALGCLDEIGTLERGKSCDMAIWDVAEPAELVYRIGFNPLHMRVREGRWTPSH